MTNNITSVSFSAYHSSVILQKFNDIAETDQVVYNYLQKNSHLLEQLKQSTAVLIKPNITSGEPPEKGRTSHPLILKHLILNLLSCGVKNDEIIVADSSVIGVDTISAAKEAGIIDVCQELSIHFIDLNAGNFKDISLKKPLCQHSIPVHELGISPGIFKINLGKIKTTYGCPANLCVKNLKGLIPSHTKMDFHLKGIQESLFDLRNILSFDLNILEGFPASELGSPQVCNVMGISDNDILLDSFVSELMGIPHDSVLHLKLLNEDRKYDISSMLENETFQYIQKSLPNYRFALCGITELEKEFDLDIIDGKPCTACLNCFTRSVQKLTAKSQLPKDHAYVLGLWHVDTHWESYEKKPLVFIGECSLGTGPVSIQANEKDMPNQRISRKGIVIPGCPPTIGSIKSILGKVHQSSMTAKKKNPPIPVLFTKQIRQACKKVAEQARFVKIHYDHIPDYVLSLPIDTIISPTLDPTVNYLGKGDDTAAFILILDTINFGSGYFPCLNKIQGKSGCLTITSYLNEAFHKNGVISAKYLQEMTIDDCFDLFKQDKNNPVIKELMQHFTKALNDLGQFVMTTYNGSFVQLIRSAESSVEKLIGQLIQMPYFKDQYDYQGLSVPFYKRAQLTAADLSIAFDNRELGYFYDLDNLTIFADNLVPHVLRMDQILEFKPSLLAQIENNFLIRSGSLEEIEIRACALYAVECIREAFLNIGKKVTSYGLDYLFWNRGQQPEYKAIPRHRARSISY